MTEDEMRVYADILNAQFTKVLPKPMKAVVLLYDTDSSHLMTLGNAHPNDIHQIIKLGLEVIETQLSAMASKPANDTPPSFVRCSLCGRVTASQVCAACEKMRAPRNEGHEKGSVPDTE